MTIAALFLAILLLLAAGMPVAFAILLPTLVYFLSSVVLPDSIVIQRVTSSVESFPLLAVPFFVLAGTIMHHARIVKRILALANVFVGHLPGGLAQVTVLSGTMLGAMSGSANADTAIAAKTLAPAMIQQGYSRGMSTVLAAVSGVLAPIIPPSIGLILYGLLANVSVGKLFMAGILPGIVLMLGLMLANAIIARRRGLRRTREVPPTFTEVVQGLRESFWALLLPIFIIVGLRIGVFTPTELGAFVVAYCLFLGLVVYREIRLRDLLPIFRQAVVTTAIVMLILGAGGAFNFLLAWEQVPQAIAKAITEVTSNSILLLLLINIGLLALGMMMESASLLIILTPILAPLTQQLGVDPVHFGIILVLNLTIGGLTPPVGTLMYTACSIVPCKVADFVRELWPYLGVLIGVLLLITYVPQISLFLPNLLLGQ
jgi:tripartite ATP-independent transporter DctM subunit